MNCVHGVRLDKDCLFCINGTEPKTVVPDNRNDLLRSAYQIASRNGENTNWEAFKNNIQHELLRLASCDASEDEQVIARATCTPLTYRLPSISSVTEKLAKAIADLPNPAEDDKTIDEWAEKLANDISKGKD